MGSSGGGGGGNPQALMGQNTPMPGLPIAGSGGSIGDPAQYGSFENFLPDIKGDGTQNPMATGLTADMFKFLKPDGSTPTGNSLGGGGVPPPGGGGAGDTGSQIQDLRNALAALQANQQSTPFHEWGGGGQGGG